MQTISKISIELKTLGLAKAILCNMNLMYYHFFKNQIQINLDENGVTVKRKELLKQIEDSLKSGISHEDLVSQLKETHKTSDFQNENFDLLVAEYPTLQAANEYKTLINVLLVSCGLYIIFLIVNTVLSFYALSLPTETKNVGLGVMMKPLIIMGLVYGLADVYKRKHSGFIIIYFNYILSIMFSSLSWITLGFGILILPLNIFIKMKLYPNRTFYGKIKTKIETVAT